MVVKILAGKVVVLFKRVEWKVVDLHPSDITEEALQEHWLLHCIVFCLGKTI